MRVPHADFCAGRTQQHPLSATIAKNSMGDGERARTAVPNRVRWCWNWKEEANVLSRIICYLLYWSIGVYWSNVKYWSILLFAIGTAEPDSAFPGTIKARASAATPTRRFAAVTSDDGLYSCTSSGTWAHTRIAAVDVTVKLPVHSSTCKV